MIVIFLSPGFLPFGMKPVHRPAELVIENVKPNLVELLARAVQREGIPCDMEMTTFSPMMDIKGARYNLTAKVEPSDTRKLISELDRKYGIKIAIKGSKAVASTVWPEFAFIPEHALTPSEFESQLDPDSLAAKGFKDLVRPELLGDDQIVWFRYSVHPYLTRHWKLTQVIEGTVNVRRPTKTFFCWFDETMLYYPGMQTDKPAGGAN